MTDRELLSRRRFLRRCTGQVLGASAASTLLDFRLVSNLMAAGATPLTDYKALICVHLSGGHDANNLILPINGAAYTDYVSARGGLMNYDALNNGATGGLALSPTKVARPATNLAQLPYALPITVDGNPTGLDFGMNAYTATLKTSVSGTTILADDGDANNDGLWQLFKEARMGFVANVGTLVEPMNRTKYTNKIGKKPPQLFSHNDQVYQWQTSIPDQPSRTGWAGRTADLLFANPYNAQAGSAVSMSISLAGSNTIEVGDIVAQYQINSNGAVTLSAASTTARKDTILNMLGAGPDITGTGRQTYIDRNFKNYNDRDFRGIAERAINNATIITEATTAAQSAGGYTPVGFPNTGLGNQLKMIAQLINATRPNHPLRGDPVQGPKFLPHKRQVFFCSLGGFDTHLGQPKSQNALLAELSGALYAFYRSTEAMGIQDSVTSFTASDFGRTLKNNAVGSPAGSDHGWGSHHMVVGGAVKGRKMYGTFPTLKINGPDDTSDGRWIPTTSVDEYSATLAKWFGVPETSLPAIFPNLPHFPNPDLGFMV